MLTVSLFYAGVKATMNYMTCNIAYHTVRGLTSIEIGKVFKDMLQVLIPL